MDKDNNNLAVVHYLMFSFASVSLLVTV